MLCKARRMTGHVAVEPISWSAVLPLLLPSLNTRPTPDPSHVPEIPASSDAIRDDSGPDVAALEQAAFMKGYAEGERTAKEAAAGPADELLQRLAASLDQFEALRTDMLRRTERTLVRLAIGIAERLMRREITLDGELILTMARVAIDRLGESVAATVRLHPEDHAALVARRGPEADLGAVNLLADPSVPRGGCLVRSELGLIDAGVHAQIDELSRALLGGDELAAEEDELHARVAD